MDVLNWKFFFPSVNMLTKAVIVTGFSVLFPDPDGRGFSVFSLDPGGRRGLKCGSSPGSATLRKESTHD